MYLLQNIDMRSDTNLFFHSMVTHESFLWGRWPCWEADHSLISSVRLKMSGALPLLHLYDFVVKTGTPYFPFAFFSGGGMSFVPVVFL